MKALAMLLQISFITLVAMHTNWQSPNRAQRSSPIGIGEVAPDFTLEDQNGNKVTLSAASGQGPVIVVFYRGYW